MKHTAAGLVINPSKQRGLLAPELDFSRSVGVAYVWPQNAFGTQWTHGEPLSLRCQSRCANDGWG